ncbi:endosialin [Sceloporus undulatus]|uniref:endosialin n=1 Tax=Sceloporus undulatus TaxID=8520 RepID=UPI001C4AA65D|nr:endosialin [Sceloporus undulatus]
MLLLLLLPWLLLAGPWLASSSPSSSSSPGDPPLASCSPEGCFAVYGQRRTFLEAWRSCRELGGNLATLKRAQEAAQVSQLLRSHAEDGDPQQHQQPPRRLFWIGLQRQPRQCHPQKPLRGFTWTTGEQDTVYTNWARPIESGAGNSGPSCAAPRCVVLDDQDFQWLEGSCTVPVDGFVCRFAFQGMCPGLDRVGKEVAITYSTPFGPAGPHLRYLPFGTVATVRCGPDLASPVVSVLCFQQEDNTVGWSKTEPICPDEVYPSSGCEGDNGGCQQLCLDEGSAGYSCECHTGYYLLPDGHSCATHDACKGNPCPFGCLALPEGGYQCQCPAGYELGPDGHQCEDVDECAEEAPCEHQCENTEGSFLCRCHLGFSPAEEDPGQCVDTDECQFPGVCQQMCVNYVGGFECYCTEGYELDADGISCVLVAQLPPSATAQSHPGGGGGYFQPFGVGHGWEPEVDDRHYLDDRLPASDPFSAFQDIWVPSPDLPSIPDSRVVPRMVPDTETPELAPLDWNPSLLETVELSRIPKLPSTTPTTSPHPIPTRSLLPTPIGTSEDLSTHLMHPVSDPHLPLVPTTTLPMLPPTDGIKGGVAVWGVRALPPSLPPQSPTPSEEGTIRPKRDDRWLLVALLVPICVFVVIMLALGIVYCTRCGAQAKTRSVTQCYRWVISSAGKGAPPPSSSRACQPATCRTSV